MNLDLAKKAKEELEEQLMEAISVNKYASAIAKPCMEALGSFAEQDEEFARAILDGDFKECMEKITKGIGGSISDIEVYRRAAQFYFPGAKVNFEMTIAVNPYEDGGKASDAGSKDMADGARVTKEPVRVFKKYSLDDLI